MSLIQDLRKTKARAVEKLGTDEAINDALVYEALKSEIAEIDAKLARAEDAQSRAAALALPAGRHAEGEAQMGVEGYDEPEEMTRRDYLRALARADGVNSFNGRHGRSALGGADMTPAQKFERALDLIRAKNGIRFDRAKYYRSLGEQLQAVQTYYMSRGTNLDSRLVRAPTGAGEVDPTGGGFLLQEEFAQAIFMLAHDMGQLLGRVNKLPIGANSNGIKIPGIDETSRATGSRWGGVQSYWADEATTVTPTKPKFRMIEFSLHKLFSLMYTTDEMLQDSTALTNIAAQAFPEEVLFMSEDAIFEGSGAGQPLGFMKSGALITVAAETGQKSGTLLKANLDKMWSRMWHRSRSNSIWTINQDVEPELLALNQAVGTGGQLVYLPPGGLSDEPYGKLYGRPVIPTEYNSTLGTAGDIALVDLSQYTLVDKGGVQAATSMHVAFLTDQQVFRITYRVDGQPMWTVPLTPFKGSATKSPFVVLNNR